MVKAKIRKTSKLKLLLVLLVTTFLLILTGCLNEDIHLPSFMREEWKQTDIIEQRHIFEAITMYKKDKISKLSFNMSVNTFENQFYSQIKYIDPMTPQFFIEMETELHLLYNQTKSFSPVKSDEANYFKQTILRLSNHMLMNMELSKNSYVLKVFYNGLDTRLNDYDFDYLLSVVETIVACIELGENKEISVKELTEVRKNLTETGSPFKRKEIKIGLRYALKSMERLIFEIDERLLKIDLLRKEVHDSRGLFVSNDSSFNLMQSLKKVKATKWLNKADYPLVMGNGYVEVMPTETYRVRQYGILTGKVYVFDSLQYRYRATQENWIWGSYVLKDSTMKLTVGKYVTEIEVFRINSDAYLMGSEVLLLEK